MEIWQIIRAIIAVVVIFVVILIATGFFRPLYEELSRKPLTTQEEQQNTNNFDALISNIEKCYIIEDTECVCDGLPNYPGSFAIGSKLIFDDLPDNKIHVNLTHKDKTYKEHTLQGIKIAGIFYDTKVETPYRIKKTLDFSKEPPLFKQEGSRKGILWWTKDILIISSFIYKKEDGIYFIVGYEKPPLVQFRKCGE